MASSKVYEIVTEKVLAALERGVAPWTKPWRPAGGGSARPLRMSTKRPYRGANVFLLWFSAEDAGYQSAWWGTFEQIKARGGMVRKGQKSTLVTFWKQTVRREEGEDAEEKRGFLLRYFNVFNEEQADWPDGSPFAVKDAGEPFPIVTPIEAAEAVWAGYAERPSLRQSGDNAAYSPIEDAVLMPAIEQFESAEKYHSTFFHEMTHSTGHAKRLGRDGIADLGPGHRFGSESYAKEELVAEMGAAYLCAVSGIENAATVEHSAAYLRNWSFKLKQDPRMFVSAAAQAQRAVDHVLGRTFEQNGEG